MRTFGNGVTVTDEERTSFIGSIIVGNAISQIEAARKLCMWFEHCGAPIVFQCTAVARGQQQGFWRFWNGRFWQPYSEAKLIQDIDWFLGCNVMAPQMRTLIDTVRTRVSVPHEQFDTKPIVVFRDQVLEVVDDKITVYRPGFRREDYVTTGINLSPRKMEMPEWNRMLGLIFPDKNDQKAVQELFGYSLFPAVSMQVFFLLFGEGGTGKDSVTSVLKDIVGPERVSAVALTELGKGHANEGLLEKVLNINMESESITEAGELALKMISGDSDVPINPKFMKVFSKRLPVKFVLACNKLPHFRDKSEALWDRYVGIPFKVKIGKTLANSDEKQIRTQLLLARLRPEYDGILLWALAGLKRVLATGKMRAAAFTRSAGAEEQLAEHKLETNSFLAWLGDRVTLGSGIIEKDELYQDYRRWCLEGGTQHPLGKITFGKEIKKQGVLVRKSTGKLAFYEGVQLVGPETVSIPLPGNREHLCGG